MTWQTPNLAKFHRIFQLCSLMWPWGWLPIWIKFEMELHMCLGKLHFKFCQSRCALRVVFTLKSIVTYFLAPLGPFLGTLELSDLADFFTGALSSLTHLPYQISWPYFFPKVGGLPQKCPKMAVFCSFLGAVHISNRRRALRVAPLNSPCFFYINKGFSSENIFFFGAR